MTSREQAETEIDLRQSVENCGALRCRVAFSGTRSRTDAQDVVQDRCVRIVPVRRERRPGLSSAQPGQPARLRRDLRRRAS